MWAELAGQGTVVPTTSRASGRAALRVLRATGVGDKVGMRREPPGGLSRCRKAQSIAPDSVSHSEECPLGRRSRGSPSNQHQSSSLLRAENSLLVFVGNSTRKRLEEHANLRGAIAESGQKTGFSLYFPGEQAILTRRRVRRNCPHHHALRSK